ncbi:MAG: acyl carrier protein [Syntrophotaleaceae bacterium]
MTTSALANAPENSLSKQQQVAEKFVVILNEQWGVDKEKVSGESFFLRDFGADSVDVTELVMALEESFDIEIYDQEWEKITTVTSAVELIVDKTDRRY